MKKVIILTFLCIFTGCSSFFYFPSKIFYADPKKSGIDYRDVDFKSTDGTDLHGWFIFDKLKTKKKGLVLFFHGNAQNLTSHWLNIGWMVKEGYDVFIFDYRGYGLSKGQANQQGLNKDSLAALAWAHGRAKDYPKFIVYGQSLGGAVSMRALQDFDYRSDIDLFVLDSTFISYQKIAFDKLRHAGILIPFSPLAYILVSDEYAARDFVREIDIPTLVIHGKRDPVVPYKFGQEIFRELTVKKKWWWSIEDGTHTDVFYPHHKSYRVKFLKLLNTL